MARPKAKIDWEKVDKYLQAQCDGVGIASLLGVCPDTLYLKCQKDKKMGFSEYSAIKRSEGKELLRAKQFQVAMTGDKTMLVWLGKQHLNQTDRRNIVLEEDKETLKTREDFLSKMRREEEGKSDERSDEQVQGEE